MDQRHAQIEWEFRLWWQRQHPGGRIWINRTARAQVKGGSWFGFGIPPAGPNGTGGGGPDLLAAPGGGVAVWYEVKTLDSRLSKNQIRQCRLLCDLGFAVWIIKEIPEPREGLPWELIRFEDYIIFRALRHEKSV